MNKEELKEYELFLENLPDFEKDFPFPKNLPEKIKKSLNELEKSTVM